MAGRRSAKVYSKTERLLTAKEESILLLRYGILQHASWLQLPKDARILALEIVKKRGPDAGVGEDWVRRSLYNDTPK